MRNPGRAVCAFLLLLSAAWYLTSQTDWSTLDNFLKWRGVLMQYSGVLAIGVMSLAMILSARPAFLERHLDGLDKLYRLHKWLGISALVLSVAHWLLAKGPKWAVSLGLMERPQRGPRPQVTEEGLRALFSSLRGLAEDVGEWGFYLAAVLMILALVKRFPYRRFVQTHRLLALVYLALVFHSVVLLKFEDWAGLTGVLMALLMAGGSLAAVLSLLQKRASGARVTGSLSTVEALPLVDVLRVDVQLQPGWPGHQAGQFAFVTFHRNEGAHPFTIASAWQDDGHLRFLIKGLGDYTSNLPQRLQAGDSVTVEGPYGCFDFDGPRRQIWIAGGIGITPFIARLKALAGRSDSAPIDLYHSTRVYDPVAIERLQQDATAAGVRLHVLCSNRGERLDLQALLREQADWQDAGFWFCGPAAFGHSLRASLQQRGLPADRFHQELFEMR